MLTAFIKEWHDYIDTMCLTCSCGNNSLQILKMVIRRHVILVTADSVCGTVVGNVYHNVKVGSSDRFLNDSLTFTGTETRTFALHDKRVFAVSLWNIVKALLFYKFLTEFYQVSVYLLCKFAAALQRSDTNRCDRHRFLKQFYVRHDIPPK